MSASGHRLRNPERLGGVESRRPTHKRIGFKPWRIAPPIPAPAPLCAGEPVWRDGDTPRRRTGTASLALCPPRTI